MPSPPPLSAGDVLTLLARLGDVAEQVILVGGQAVNVWVEHYRAQERLPELSTAGAFTSKDVDFCAARDVVRSFAARLPKGRAKFPSLDDATPNVGIVIFADDGGYERTIDFLSAPFGMDAAAVQRRSVRYDLYDAEGRSTGHGYRLMHPVDCMESRVHNVVGLAHAYDTPHGRKQLRASVFCAREALKDILDTPTTETFNPVRTVLDLNERIFQFCLHDRNGRVVVRTGIDPLDAVLIDPRLGARFTDTRVPQVRARLAALRAKLSGA